MTGKPLLVLDLFCGCGGMSLGFIQAFQGSRKNLVLIGIDLDLPALKTHHLNLKKKSHVIRADVWHLPLRPVKYDIVIGGPPCQGFSVLAKYARESNPKTAEKHAKLRQLVFAFAAAVEVHRSTFFVMENVPGMRNHPEFEKLRDRLERVFYFVTIASLNASDYGVPQYRQRLFFLGSIFEPPTPPAPTHFGYCPKCKVMVKATFYTIEPGFVETMYYCVKCKKTWLKSDHLLARPYEQQYLPDYSMEINEAITAEVLA